MIQSPKKNPWTMSYPQACPSNQARAQFHVQAAESGSSENPLSDIKDLKITNRNLHSKIVGKNARKICASYGKMDLQKLADFGGLER